MTEKEAPFTMHVKSWNNFIESLTVLVNDELIRVVSVYTNLAEGVFKRFENYF